VPEWAVWLGFGILAWVALSVPLGFLLARVFGAVAEPRAAQGNLPARPQGSGGDEDAAGVHAPGEVRTVHAGGAEAVARRRVLVVDDDPALRLLLRTTLAADEFEVDEAASAEEAAGLARFWRPAFVILDVGLPGADGLTICRELKFARDYGSPTIILLTGADTSEEDARDAGADALLRKPFSPLELVSLLERLASRSGEFVARPPEKADEQLLLYARDLSRLLEIERAQRRLLEHAYRQTTTVLADALEAKDRRTGLHAMRVQSYALELTSAFDRSLLDDPSLQYGFLLHDIGKLAIPDGILNKAGPLADDELQVVQEHPLIGVEFLQDVPLLQGEGLRVVRSHHERWDGTGYPDGLAEQQIPIGARIFAVADTLDAITTERPYREARSWGDAVDEILTQDGRQFDPRVVTAFAIRERRLRRLHAELTTMVA
jgi:response regulator RpfG family c-di-GMP phosphodiesterase